MQKACEEIDRNKITALRVAATLLILLTHVRDFCAFPGILDQVAAKGADGLLVLYFLSGYLVVHSWESRASTADYWRKRARRLFPLYYVMLALCLFVNRAFYVQYPRVVICALAMLNFVTPPPYAASWSMTLTGVLAIFWMIYCLIPLLSRLASTPARAFGLFWLSLIVYCSLPPFFSWLYRGVADPAASAGMAEYGFRFLPYACGGIMARRLKEEKNMALAALYGLIILGYNTLYPFMTDSGGIVLVALLTAILMVRIQLPGDRVWKLLRFVDSLSVGIILVQPYLLPWIKARLGFYPEWFQHVSMIAATYALACVLHWVVEWPGKKLIDRMFKYLPQGKKENL